MLNIISLSLLLSTLVSAGFFSPPPAPNPLLRDAHRLIVVEFDRESAPPAETPNKDDSSSNDKIPSLISSTKHKLAQLEESGSEAAAAVAAKAKDAAEHAAGNISAAAKKAEATAEELRGNLTDLLRRASDLGRDFAAHVWVMASGAARSAVAVLHLLGFGIAFGSCVWVTFLNGHVLASSLPRQQFASVQSRLYPVYFRAVAFGVAAAAAAVYFGERGAVERTQGYTLLGVLVMVMVNMLYLEPKATKAMFERMKLEKEEGRGREVLNSCMEPVTAVTPPVPNGPAKKAEMAATKSEMLKASSRLRRLNSYSSLLNMLSLMALGWHLVYLARRMESSC